MIIKKTLRIWRGLPARLLTAGMILFLSSQCVYAQVQDVIDTREQNNVLVYKGDLVSLKVYSLTRIAITNPGIIEIVNADVDELLIIGKRVGETPIYIWDEYGKRNLIIRVFNQDLSMVIQRIERLFEKAEIEGLTLETNDYEGKIVVTGVVPKDKKKAYDDIMSKFKSNIIDMSKVEGELIQIDVQVSELSETLAKVFGFNWTTGGEGLVLGYEEKVPAFDGSLGDWFRIGNFTRTSQILATVSALVQEGKGRVLSKPSVIVNDGESSSFIVGGEIPIVTTVSTSGGNVSESVSYKNYGVQVSITPTIKGKKIETNLSVSVRDIDSSNPVVGQIAFVTTSASTKLSLDNNQTVVLAGLIKHDTSDTVKRVPVLSKIPILGILFRSRAVPLTDKEVVISLTPKILSRMEETKENNEDDFSLMNKEDTGLDQEEPAEQEMPQGQGPEEGNIDAEKETKQDNLLSLEGKVDELLKAEPAQKTAALKEEAQDTAQEMEKDVPEEALQESQDDSFEIDDMVNDMNYSEEEPEQDAAKEEPSEDVIAYPKKTIYDEANATDAITEYVRSIQRKISKAISFPLEAKAQGWYGTVRLSMLILSDGSLQEVKVKESSGHSILDKDAVNTSKVLAPYDPFPAEISQEEIWVTLPIIYGTESLPEGTK